jgi:beta-ketodecanoyl-[acyl-carrier-protein] synthase
MTVDTRRAQTKRAEPRAGDLPARAAVISGRGRYVPDDVLTNEDVASGLDESKLRFWLACSKWARTRVEELHGSADVELDRKEVEALYAEYVGDRIGIRERRVVDRQAILEQRPSTNGVFGSDLGARAAQGAIDAAGVDVSDIEMIICGTSTPDAVYPPTAVEIQDRLGAEKAHAFDLLAACSSFAYGLHLARGMIGAGIHRRILVVSAEYFTCGVNYTDPSSAFFWGDGAAAAVLEPAADCAGRGGLHVADTHALSIPSLHIRTGLGGTRSFVARGATGGDPDFSLGAPDDPYFYQDGRRVFRDVVPRVADETITFLERNGIDRASIGRYWFHQPSALFLGSIVKRLLDAELHDPRVAIGYDRFGNTSSAGAPMCLAADDGLRPGQHGCLSVFGAGYTIGLALLRAVAA